MTDEKRITVSQLLARINNLRRLGLVRERPGVLIQTMAFGITQQEMDIASEAYFAFVTLYQIRGEHLMLLREALTYQYYYCMNQARGDPELKEEALSTRIKWQ